MVMGRVDGDVLVYEIGFAAEASWRYHHAAKGVEVETPPPFEWVLEMLERRVPQIVEEAGADDFVVYLTGKKNFRNHIAKTTPYKARVGNKPFHYKNIRAIMPTMFLCREYEGLEADDLISLALTHNPDDIAISRDKDIRQIPGTHYSWELENQPAIGPHKTDEFGFIQLRKDKLFGYGDKFLYGQILMGDSVDSIPGCPLYGPKKAFAILEGCNTAEEYLNAIIPIYQKCYKLEWKTVMREQARLVHLIRRFENGRALLWDFPGSEETWCEVQTGKMFPSAQSKEEF